MIDDLFPDKTSPEIDDNEWLDYCIGTWCLNSVEAVKTIFRKPYYEAKEADMDYVIIKKEDLETLNNYLQRFEQVYCWLYGFWRKIVGIKK